MKLILYKDQPTYVPVIKNIVTNDNFNVPILDETIKETITAIGNPIIATHTIVWKIFSLIFNGSDIRLITCIITNDATA